MLIPCDAEFSWGAYLSRERERERGEKDSEAYRYYYFRYEVLSKGNRREWWTLIFDKNNKKIIEKLQYYNTERVCKRESECVEELLRLVEKKSL